MTAKIPFLRPNPPKLTESLDQLAAIDASHIFSNYGPVNTRLEAALVERMFGGQGGCLTVCNATIGLMLAIRLAIGAVPDKARIYALMPSFTFAATAHAALWCGLTPLLCDIEPDTWLPSAAAEHGLIERYRDQIAVIVPYATFGNNLDLDRYEALSARTGIPIVVDAAASLGSRNPSGANFGGGFSHPVIYSMHATKAFATSEAGLIYCADRVKIETLRAMGNFGFEQPRTATLPGLNSKLSEIAALLALRKLEEFDAVVAHRLSLTRAYQEQLGNWSFQHRTPGSDAQQFVSVLLPAGYPGSREAVLNHLNERGIGFGTYFDPHLANQPYFSQTCVCGDLDATQQVAGRIISLPLSDLMTEADVAKVCQVVQDSCS
jgi:dTDP-4-amino-4,6-dideoxygalactose transaminase